MKFTTAIALALLILPCFTRAEDKKPDEKAQETMKKFVGDWEVTKATDEALTGAAITFAKDGKLVIEVENAFKIEGKWRIEDGKLITEVTVEGQTHSDTDEIKKLAADDIELENKEGKIVVLKRKKAK